MSRSHGHRGRNQPAEYWGRRWGNGRASVPNGKKPTAGTSHKELTARAERRIAKQKLAEEAE